MRLRPVLPGSVALCVALVMPSAASAKHLDCGTFESSEPTIGNVSVAAHGTSCRTARRVARTYDRGDFPASPWRCGLARQSDAPVLFSCGYGGTGGTGGLRDMPHSLIASRADAETRYRGSVGGFGETRRDRAQGQYHGLRFRVTPPKRVTYRVCLSGPASRCWSRRTGGNGRSSVNASLFVNDQGGPGRWTATWYVKGRKVSSWRFRLRSEGV